MIPSEDRHFLTMGVGKVSEAKLCVTAFCKSSYLYAVSSGTSITGSLTDAISEDLLPSSASAHPTS